MPDLAPHAGRRRALLAGAAMLLARSLPASAATPAFPTDCSLLVAGPEDGALARLGRVLTQALLPDPAAAPLGMTISGGADGVTAANQFATRIARDGGTALLVPGAAALAWLAGDPRAQFDAGDWAPAMVGIMPGLLVGRTDRAALTPGRRLRVAAGGPAGVETPAFMAADLLGLATEPVFGLADSAAAARALSGGAVDAIWLASTDTTGLARMLAAAGLQPLFALGLPDADGPWQRDPAFPDVPTALELMAAHTPAAPLLAAWRATAVASQLAWALILSALTPAALVAQWRQGATGALPALQSATARPLAGVEAQATLAALKVDAPALQALRGWLAAR